MIPGFDSISFKVAGPELTFRREESNQEVRKRKGQGQSEESQAT